MKRWFKFAVVTPIVAAAASARGQTTVLYDGTAGGGTTPPENQTWLSYTSINLTTPTHVASHTTAGGETTLDTTSDANIHAGYSNYTLLGLGSIVNNNFPVLDPTTGFTVSLNVKIDSETHGTNTDRSGFSWIVLDKNAKGIELEFWPNDVWAQSTSFTHDEDDSFTTNTASHQFDLSILNNTYTLFADGNQILTGATRTYSGLPYGDSNLVVIADDTTEASASEDISRLSVSVPEPVSAMVGLAGAGVALSVRPKRRSAADSFKSTI